MRSDNLGSKLQPGRKGGSIALLVSFTRHRPMQLIGDADQTGIVTDALVLSKIFVGGGVRRGFN